MCSLDSNAARLATRLAFFVAGFGLACWAPLIPFVRESLQLDNGTLGLLLLCLGVGSVSAMIITGAISAKYGSKSIIILSGFTLAVALPFLAIATSTTQLALTLIVFGAALGSLDVAMNLHAVEVEKASNQTLMSGFHALYSVGGFFGSAVMTFMLSMKMNSTLSTLVAASLMIAAMVLTKPRLADTSKVSHGPMFSLPRGLVLILAILAGIIFLIEGAMLDWGALLITDAGLVSSEHAGIGYIVFAAAMLTGRFFGDAVTKQLGDRGILFSGGMIAVFGILILLSANMIMVAMVGFMLIGIGASNIVPVLFRLAGNQDTMPPGLAVAAVSTVGYAGILIGPAGIGYVAKHLGLAQSFGILAGLLGLIPICAFVVTKKEIEW